VRGASKWYVAGTAVFGLAVVMIGTATGLNDTLEAVGFALLIFGAAMKEHSAEDVPNAVKGRATFVLGVVCIVAGGWMALRSSGIPAWTGVALVAAGVFGVYVALQKLKKPDPEDAVM
jgi:hypothetical protein